MTQPQDRPQAPARRDLLKLGLAGAAAAATGSAAAHDRDDDDDSRYLARRRVRSGPVGFTSFIHPTAKVQTDAFSIGAQSLIEGFVTLQGASARIGNAANLQDNDRLLDYAAGRQRARGDLVIGDGSFTAHGVTFIGKVRIGEASGTVINAVVQNARVGDASLTGFTARILGDDPQRPIEIPDASLVLFGARIRSQADVAANIIPVPAPFSLFAADVDQENLLLARGYNLLHRAASRTLPFSADPASPRNPGADFPDLASAFGKLSVAPPTVDRRGTGPLPTRQATLGDLSFQVFQPQALGAPSAAPDSAEAGARFIRPRVASPELVDDGAIVLGGVELAAGVVVGAGSYLHGGDAPAISVGAGTRIGRNTSIHELTFTSVRIGKLVSIGDRVVLHGPLEIGNHVSIGDGAVLFGPRVADGVRIGAGALVFGPVEITRDVPAGAIVVPAGNEFLIAPSHAYAQGTLKPSGSMLAEWRRASDAGGACGCGVGALLHTCRA